MKPWRMFGGTRIWGLRGISARLSAFAWLVTLFTLTIFVTVIIPQQEADLLAALRSKSVGMASSLQEVTASAAISEDYSSVVDQCLQALSGDAALIYVVITRNDGFSVVVDRTGWRTEQLDAQWHPAVRQQVSSMEYVALARERVFHFGKPVDYSGLQWGWIHIGLSLNSYEESLRSVYRRTGFLAVLCTVLSLLASLWYARRMVHPILGLQEVVQRVARGDLGARSHIQTRDEIQTLGESFNAMTESIVQRNRVLESIRFAAQELLSAADWHSVVPKILEKTARAAGVSRAYVLQFGGEAGNGGEAEAMHSFRWDGADSEATPDDRDNGRLAEELGMREHAARLRNGEVVHLGKADFPEDGRSPAILSRILLPVLVNGSWWGVLSFDDCEKERAWSDAESDTFQAVAGTLGAAIARRQAEAELRLANETLEARVEERTRELTEQVNAKERARAELAVTQQRLIEVSRQAGMAEVATNVLHNVGNVLNSVNTSAGVVANLLQESRVNNLITLSGMIEQNQDDLPSFLAHDPKGQRVLPYLAKMGEPLRKERERMMTELHALTDHIGHIKSIVSTQQSYASVSGLIEQLRVNDLVEDAIRIVEAGFARHQIHIARDYEELPVVAVDKHQILQILLNLLRNAKQATAEAGKAERVILVRIAKWGEDRYRIVVEDNGVGLPAENLTRIFAHGFTTKRDGHGFGLHSSALAAKQMGGSLRAESEGLGKGARFTLELPLKANGGAGSQS